MMLDGVELVRALEERLVNVWPAVDTLLMDGWAVRFANGYSGRANAASAVVVGATMTPPLLDEIERLYRAEGLRPCVRVTPVCHPDVEGMLLARGYRARDSSRIMLLDLAPPGSRTTHPGVAIEDCPSPAWLAGVSERQSADKRDPAHLAAIVGRIKVAAAFATLRLEGNGVGFGMSAIDRGFAEIGSVMIDAALRGRGLGRAVVEALLAWAEGRGAHAAFLQVDAANAPALALYASQGFRDLGGYRTMIRD